MDYPCSTSGSDLDSVEFHAGGNAAEASVSISVGMAAVPAPGGLGDLADVGISRSPAQLLDDLLGSRDQCAGIARTPADDLVSDRAADNRLAGVEHLQHRRTRSRPEVVRPSHSRLERFNRKLMSLRQVVGMHIVAHAGAVPGVPVSAEDQ